LSAGAVACGDFAGPGVTGFSGTHPVHSNEAAASTGITILQAIFDPLDKPMRNRLGGLSLGSTRKTRFFLDCLLDCIARGPPL
jgi:hypothetical protein